MKNVTIYEIPIDDQVIAELIAAEHDDFMDIGLAHALENKAEELGSGQEIFFRGRRFFVAEDKIYVVEYEPTWLDKSLLKVKNIFK